MNSKTLKERLRVQLGRDDLRFETIAILAEVISADARFKEAVAQKKMRSDNISSFDVSDVYEPIVKSCTVAMASFVLGNDEERLVRALVRARDSLQEHKRALEGRAFW